MASQRPRVTPCPACDDPIIWAVTEAGNKTPVDVGPAEHGTIALSGHVPPVARVVSKTGREPGTKLYVSHFATCKAAKHRKAPTQRPPVPAMPQGGLFSERSVR